MNIAGKMRKTSGKRIDREVAHDLAGRGAEGFSLENRPDERTHPGRVGASQHPLQRVVRRQAHALLLQRQAELDPERALQPVSGHLEGGEEA